MSWHVLLTEPNRERTAVRHLELLLEDKHSCYLPIISRAYCQHSRHGRRWQVYRKSMFPGYLFVRAREDLFRFVGLVAGIRKRSCPFLTNHGTLAIVRNEKIREIQALEQTINLRRSERMGFQVGDRVLVRDGAFTGTRAIVHTLSDRERVVLLLDFLGQKTKVQLGVDQVDAMAA